MTEPTSTGGRAPGTLIAMLCAAAPAAAALLAAPTATGIRWRGRQPPARRPPPTPQRPCPQRSAPATTRASPPLPCSSSPSAPGTSLRDQSTMDRTAGRPAVRMLAYGGLTCGAP